MSDQPHQADPEILRAAEAAEGALLLKAENNYLRQRVVTLSAKVRHLAPEVERLAAEVERLAALVSPEPQHRAASPEGEEA